MYGIALELRGDCPNCGGPVIVNALNEQIHCRGCLQDFEYPYTEWADLLESAFELGPDAEPGRGGKLSILGEGWRLQYSRFDPYCFACKHDFDMRLVQASIDPYPCPSCGERWHHRPLPPEAHRALPGVRWLVGESPAQIPGRTPDDSVTVEAKPILFSCMGCGGALTVDGTNRVVNCSFCDASNYLPDDLWLRMHPVETVQRWFLWCDEAALPGKRPADDEEESAPEPDFFAEDDTDPGVPQPTAPAPPAQPAATRSRPAIFWVMVLALFLLVLGIAGVALMVLVVNLPG